MKPFEQVVKFNKEILDIDSRPLGLQSEDEYRLSHHQMNEEIIEFLEACINDDYIGAIDACIDNLVFTMGVLYKLGIDDNLYEKIFTTVMEANFSKKKGVKKGREGYAAVDAMKPSDFISPEDRIRLILEGAR